ncbi:MAG: hypothetical protein HYZ72_17115 [Deltaproteobacteria bacterium]|nr:hypothetical protein [Deltaproteobacteria bacterium]
MKPLLAALALTIVLIPTFAVSAERDGVTFFFSFEELTEMLRHPAPPQLTPRSALQPRGEEAGQESRIEREYRWGNGMGINSYAYPGTQHRPMWGY